MLWLLYINIYSVEKNPYKYIYNIYVWHTTCIVKSRVSKFKQFKSENVFKCV